MTSTNSTGEILNVRKLSHNIGSYHIHLTDTFLISSPTGEPLFLFIELKKVFMIGGLLKGSLATRSVDPENIKKLRTAREVGKSENGMSIAGGRPNLPHAPLTCGDKKRGDDRRPGEERCPLSATDFIDAFVRMVCPDVIFKTITALRAENFQHMLNLRSKELKKKADLRFTKLETKIRGCFLLAHHFIKEQLELYVVLHIQRTVFMYIVYFIKDTIHDYIRYVIGM